MTNLTLTLAPEALREATCQAITGILTPEMKDQLLQKAIANVLAPSTNSWDKGQSPIERAFANAIEQVAQKEAFRLISEDESIKLKIEQLMRDVAEKVIDTDTEKLAARMADAFVSSMRRD